LAEFLIKQQKERTGQ